MKKIFYLLIFIVSTVCESLSKEIPVITISAGKTEQNINTVGSDISSISENDIEKSSSFFLGNLLHDNLNGMNFSQTGGYGTNSLIQLRGLPKRYTTVYIDGVKMSDPSTPDNAFYFSNVTMNGIKSVEILKGSQSSLYGSGAIGGTVIIQTKKGRPGHHQNVETHFETNNTKGLNLSFDGKNNYHNYFLGINKYSTAGISAMNDNDENDRYKNNGIVANYGYALSDYFSIENNLRLVKSALEYDEVTSGRLDANSTEDRELSNSFKIITDNLSGIRNTLSYNKTKIKRSTLNYNIRSNYNGNRDSINLLGEYNVNLDNKIIYGLDNDFDTAKYGTWATNGDKKTGEKTYGQYFDYHFRPLEKIHTTLGARRDHHTTAGAYKTYRITGAYKFNLDSKFRTSFGTGIRFPSLNDLYYDTNVKNPTDLKPEKSKSFDIGLDKDFKEQNLKFSITLFKVQYKDSLSNWASNTDGGNNTSGYTIQNSGGEIYSRGLEFFSNYQPKKGLSYNLNYTYTDAYDGEDCDDPAYNCTVSTYPVRVPKHSLGLKISKKFNNNINLNISARHTGKVRDYGNANNGYADVLLSSFTLFNVSAEKEVASDFIVSLKINNILNKEYEQAHQYSGFPRLMTINLLKKW